MDKGFQYGCFKGIRRFGLKESKSAGRFADSAKRNRGLDDMDLIFCVSSIFSSDLSRCCLSHQIFPLLQIRHYE